MYYRRLKRLVLLLVVMMMVIVGKLIYLQFFRADYYRAKAASVSLRERLLSASRGTIYDRRGKRLAYDELSFGLHMRLDRLDNLENATAYQAKLSELLGISPDELQDDVERCHRKIETQANRMLEARRKTELRYMLAQFQLVRSGLSFEQWAAVEYRYEELVELSRRRKSSSRYGRSQPVMEMRPGLKRTYPEGETACHILGYLSLPQDDWREVMRNHQDLKVKYHADPEAYADEYLRSLRVGDRVGATGLERQYEALLRGRRGLAREVVNVRGAVQESLYELRPGSGKDLHLTLDLELQKVAEERALGERPGSVVMLDPRDGAVLALVSYPRFDRNTFQSESEFSKLLEDKFRPLVNRAIQEYYQPASVFKVVGALAGLESGALAAQSSFHCNGSLLVGNRTFHCWAAHGSVQLREALERSCNVYFYNAALKTSGGVMLFWAQQLGFGKTTGIDLPHEKAGGLPSPRTGGDLANFAIGQGGIQVTPLQIARMMAAIANGGKLVQPHLSKDGGAAQRARKLPISVANLRVIREGLNAVVEGADGTAKQARVPGLSVAGKTGTAQTGREGVHHAWFACFAPFENPKVVLAVVVENTSGGGGDTAAPIAGEILHEMYSQGLLD